MSGESLVGHQADLDRDRLELRQREASPVEIGADPQQVLLAHVEGHVDGIELDDRRELGLLRPAHQLPDRDEVPRHDSIEGRRHAGVAEIDLGERDPRLLAHHIGFVAVALRPRFVERDLGRDVLAAQRGLTRELGLRFHQFGLRGDQGRLGLLQLGLVGRLFDDEQDVVLLRRRAVLVLDVGEEALDPRDQIDRGEGDGVAGLLEMERDGLLQRLGDVHFRRRSCDIGVFLCAAAEPPSGRQGDGASI